MLKDNLRKFRVLNNLTQFDVANKLNVKRQTYGAYERGVSIPDAITLSKLAYILNVDVNELADDYKPADENIKNDSLTADILYSAYQSADEKTRKMVDMLLDLD